MTTTNDRQKELIAEMGSPVAEAEYYAVTLLGNDNGLFTWSVQSNFAGFANEDPKRELRRASLVDPVKMAALWRDIGQAYVFVNNKTHLGIFYGFLGGNGIVERTLLEGCFPEWVAPIEIRRLGFGDMRSVGNLSPEVLRRSPSPKHRMRILNRDRRRCRVCGRSVETSVDIELDVHHIRPWSKGGVTHDRNLITLCHTCHRGLDPHEDLSLFDLVGSGISDMVIDSNSLHRRGVALYRENAARFRRMNYGWSARRRRTERRTDAGRPDGGGRAKSEVH